MSRDQATISNFSIINAGSPEAFVAKSPPVDTVLRKAIRRMARYTFPLCERLGFHIVPIHFYQPIPDSRTLSTEISERTSKMIGIDLRESAQVELLAEIVNRYQDEYDRLPLTPTPNEREFYIYNSSFGTVDAEMLYCMIRKFKPRRMIEIGGGMSTLLSSIALERNEQEGKQGELVSIEPYPDRSLVDAFPNVKLYPTEVQNVPLRVFEELCENDILFIDSSHISRIDSDVNYEFLEILPRLKPGVVVHVHDIFLPREYDVEFFKRHKVFLNEQYLLQAFLTFNDRVEVLWAGNFIHTHYPDRLKAAFRSYRSDPSPPFSWWMRSMRGANPTD